MEGMLQPYAKAFKNKGNPYSLRSNALSTQQSEAATAAAVAAEGQTYLQLT